MRLRTGTRVFPDGQRLTPRQDEVVRLLAAGLTNGQIAERLGISLDGAKFHVTELMNRYGVHSREEAVSAWNRSGGRIAGAPAAAVLKWGVLSASAIGVVLVAALAWANRSGEGDDAPKSLVETLREAAAAADETTAHFTTTFTIEPPRGVDSPQETLGQIDLRNDLMHVAAGPDGLEFFHTADTTYARSDPTEKWRRTNSPQVSPGLFATGGWLDRMDQAIDGIEVVGTEVVRGETATHYRFRTPYPAPPMVGDMYDDTDVDVELWIASGRVVRVEQSVTFQETGDIELDGQIHAMRIEFFDWGTPVDLRIPDSSEIETD